MVSPNGPGLKVLRVGRAARRRVAGALNCCGRFDVETYAANYRADDVVLYLKDVVNIPVKSFRPRVCARFNIDELNCHANPLPGLPDASLGDKVHVQLPSDSLHVDGLALNTKVVFRAMTDSFR